MADHDRDVSSEEDIEKAIRSERKKISLGNGLYLQIQKGKYFYFRYRFSVNGVENWETVGKYDGFESVVKAREKAKEFAAKVAEVRGRNAVRSFEEKLNSNKENKSSDLSRSSVANLTHIDQIKNGKKIEKLLLKSSSFRNVEDAKKFVQNIFWSASAFNKSDISHEFRFAALLLMLIPAQPDELLSIKWTDIEFGPNAEWSLWTIKRKRESNSKNNSVAFVSSNVNSVLNHFRYLVGNSEYLFPSLLQLKTKERHQELLDFMNQHWWDYCITPNGFVDFFRSMAIQSSGFSLDFIEKMLQRNHGTYVGMLPLSMHAQRALLFDWWSNELLKDCEFFSRYRMGLSRVADIDRAPVGAYPGFNSPTGVQAVNSDVRVSGGATYNSVEHASLDSNQLSHSFTLFNLIDWFKLDFLGVKDAIFNEDSVVVDNVSLDVIVGRFGLSGDPYNIKIEFSKDGSGNLIPHSECSCGNQLCSHAAIVLFKVLGDR